MDHARPCSYVGSVRVVWRVICAGLRRLLPHNSRELRTMVSVKPVERSAEPSSTSRYHLIALMLFILVIAAFKLDLSEFRTETQSNSIDEKAMTTIASSRFPNPSGSCTMSKRNWDSRHRRDRFPSVQERVCTLMHVWYDPRYGTKQQWKLPLTVVSLRR